jgi:hypothetical protein
MGLSTAIYTAPVSAEEAGVLVSRLTRTCTRACSPDVDVHEVLHQVRRRKGFEHHR